MKLFQELTIEQIINDLSFYYDKEKINALQQENDDNIRIFFNDHVQKNSQEVSIDAIFGENINKRILVSTPDGYQLIGERIEKSERNCYTVKTVCDKKISCSFDHKLETNDGWKYVKDITNKDYVLTIDGFRKIKNKWKIKKQKVYDFEVKHENHRYWGGNGISSHNTGKTYFSLLMALHLLKTEPKYKKIVLIKSLVTIKDEALGFLKGTLEEKISPYVWSFTANLDKIFGTKAITKALMESGIIEIMPIAYIRGCNIDHALVVIDEIENITMDTFKTIITRIGTDSKFIFLGDVEQCDRSNKKESCLSKVIQMFKKQDFIGILEFTDEDCVRNLIIPKILKILNNN